jgi:hypothetical protein
MDIEVVQRARAGGFDYVLFGRGTGCIISDSERIDAGGMRALLAASERDQKHFGFVLRQTAWYLPRVAWVDDPLDVGAACISYLERHPKLEIAYVVAPTNGLVKMVIDVVAARNGRIKTKLVAHPEEITTSLRALEPAIPMLWYRASMYPESGGRVSSVMPAAPPSGPTAEIPRAPALPRFDRPSRK